MDVSPVAQLNCLYCGAQSYGNEFCCTACKELFQFVPKNIQVPDQFVHLDQPNFRNEYFHEEQEYAYHLYVEGLRCSSCVHLLEKIPLYDNSVLEARVNFGKSQLFLKVDSDFSLGKLMALLMDWGYRAQFLRAKNQTEDFLALENRKSLREIGVAAAVAGNIMLFSISVYAGLSGSWAIAFHWISFALFLPLLLYSARGFYQGAWNSLRFRVINVDLSVTVALWAGFLLSTYNLIRGDGTVYYDSISSFIFLILSARYLLKRIQQMSFGNKDLAEVLEQDHYLKVSGDGELATSIYDIQKGDVIKIEAGQIIPADGVLQSAHAVVDLSLLTGESLPRHYTQGLQVFAGGRNIRSNILIQVTSDYRQSRLARIIRDVDEGVFKKVPLIQLTDRLAQILIVTVFAIAVLYFLANVNSAPQEAINRALALIVVACPCALAFSAPLTFGLAVKKAFRKGIAIKNSSVFEKIHRTKNIFFDKTGTLTHGHFEMTYSEPSVLPLETKQILLSLEQQSYHPLAFSLRGLWDHVVIDKIDNLTEIIGQGVEGDLRGNHYELKALDQTTHSSSLGLALKENGKTIARLYFDDPLRAESAHCVSELHRQGLNGFLLSGDRTDRAIAVGEACALPSSHVFAELFPEEKVALIQKHSNTCMIGDGANDALAIRAADIGIAMKGSVPLSVEASDIFFLRGGLQPLLDLRKIAAQCRRVLIRNLSISLVYNIIGATLSLLGIINPLTAAILMPISSALIILSSFWGMK